MSVRAGRCDIRCRDLLGFQSADGDADRCLRDAAEIAQIVVKRDRDRRLIRCGKTRQIDSRHNELVERLQHRRIARDLDALRLDLDDTVVLRRPGAADQ